MLATVNLDLLPLKRVLAIDEAGSEHLPPERTPEEKARFLLQRIDFEQSEEKKAKSSKESLAQSIPKWPWQGLVENLQLAQQELSYILDFLTHVEANDAITVANMLKPKQLLHEACSELALRASAKLHHFKKVGEYLKQTAKALEQQVDREAVFYGALMRLQQHWKVKRLRSISAGPGGNAGFAIDLSYPQTSAGMLWGLSVRSAGLYSVNIEQDLSGLLKADLPSHAMNTLQLWFHGPHTLCKETFEGEGSKEGSADLSHRGMKDEPRNVQTLKEPQVSKETDVREAVNAGATAAHSILRQVQTAIIHEQIFEWTVREALQPSSGLVVTGVEDRSLQLSLGHSNAIVLELAKASSDTCNSDARPAEFNEEGTRSSRLNSQGVEHAHDDPESNLNEGKHHAQKAVWKELSAFVCLQQAFYNSAFVQSQESFLLSKSGQSKSADGPNLLTKPKDFGAGLGQDAIIVETAGPLKHFFLSMRHRVLSSKVLSELEKLVQGVPYLFLSHHPTWNSRITSWKVFLEIPKSVVQGWRMSMVNWRDAQKKSGSTLHLRVILCDALLFVEGLEALHMDDSADFVQCKRSKHKCDVMELSGFLLHQLAGQLVKWLYEEALVMGLKVKRNFLSLFFGINNREEYVILASLDFQVSCINWWLHVRNHDKDNEQKEDLISSKSPSMRFVGPLNLETLRGILVDLLNYHGDES